MLENGTSIRRAILVIGALAGVALACDEGTVDPGGNGGTKVLLTDAPFPFDAVEHVYVHIVQIDASTEPDTGTSADAQNWVSIVAPDRQFDMLELQNGTTALLGEGDLPADVYRAVRVALDGDRSEIVMKDGSTPLVDWQGGLMWLHAFVEDPLAVPVAGASIVIDFDVGRSFDYRPSQDTVSAYFVFFPTLRAVNEAATGTLTGTVTADPDGDGTFTAVANANITVYHGDPTMPSNTWWIAATGRTDASGAFAIHYLTERQYIVRADPPGDVQAAAVTQVEIGIVAGQETSLDFALPRATLASVTIDGPSEIDYGQTVTYYARVTDALGNPIAHPEVGWRTLDASVDSSGAGDVLSVVAADSGLVSDSARVTGQRPGFARLLASSLGLEDTLEIRVRDPNTGPVETVILVPASATVQVGDSLSFTAELRDADGHLLSDRAIEWSISDMAVLSITGTFGSSILLSGKAVGTATVTAASEGKSGSAGVTVNN